MPMDINTWLYYRMWADVIGLGGLIVALVLAAIFYLWEIAGGKKGK